MTPSQFALIIFEIMSAYKRERGYSKEVLRIMNAHRDGKTDGMDLIKDLQKACIKT